MKLREFSKLQGVCYQTVYRWFRAGIMPYPCRQLPNGTILVDYTETKPVADVKTKIVVYARVSSSDQKDDLDRQVGRICLWATENKLPPNQTVKEIGSGLNGRRKGLIRVLADPELKAIIVEHKDRLARWGWEFIAAALTARGVQLYVVDPTETVDDITQDLIDVTTSVCARLYGKRGAKNKAAKMAKQLKE
jgi:putative resolvase